MVEVTSIIIGLLTILLIGTLWMSYLMYVRLRQLQEEVEELRSQVEMTDDELDRLESSIKSIKGDSISEDSDQSRR